MSQSTFSHGLSGVRIPQGLPGGCSRQVAPCTLSGSRFLLCPVSWCLLSTGVRQSQRPQRPDTRMHVSPASAESAAYWPSCTFSGLWKPQAVTNTARDRRTNKQLGQAGRRAALGVPELVARFCWKELPSPLRPASGHFPEQVHPTRHPPSLSVFEDSPLADVATQRANWFAFWLRPLQKVPAQAAPSQPGPITREDFLCFGSWPQSHC